MAISACGKKAEMTSASPSVASGSVQKAGLSLPQDRIGVRLGADEFGNPEQVFYNTRTGYRFVPRGMNYIRVSPNGIDHVLFDLASYPGSTPSDRQAEFVATMSVALEGMAKSGYNTVRVFINNGCNLPAYSGAGGTGTGQSESGLDPEYMNNFVAFLSEASTLRLYVIPVVYGAPCTPYYTSY